MTRAVLLSVSTIRIAPDSSPARYPPWCELRTALRQVRQRHDFEPFDFLVIQYGREPRGNSWSETGHQDRDRALAHLSACRLFGIFRQGEDARRGQHQRNLDLRTRHAVHGHQQVGLARSESAAESAP